MLGYNIFGHFYNILKVSHFYCDFAIFTILSIILIEIRSLYPLSLQSRRQVTFYVERSEQQLFFASMKKLGIKILFRLFNENFQV